MINFSALAKETYATIYVQWRARQQGPQLVYLSNTEIGHTDAQKHCQISCDVMATILAQETGHGAHVSGKHIPWGIKPKFYSKKYSFISPNQYL